MKQASLKLRPISSITRPNPYVLATLVEYKDWVYAEDVAPNYKGKWRESVFKLEEGASLDLEIGTGNGLFFSHRAESYPDRMILGIERKFKPLIQSIRRARRLGCTNARMLRYDAEMPENLFAEGELDNIYIQFPDPWERKIRWKKNRLIQSDFIEKLFKIQKTGSFLEFKTDHREYFDWSLDVFKASNYRIDGLSFDLHNSEYAEENFVTQFESLFLRKHQPIHYARLSKP